MPGVVQPQDCGCETDHEFLVVPALDEVKAVWDGSAVGDRFSFIVGQGLDKAASWGFATRPYDELLPWQKGFLGIHLAA